MGNFNGWSSKSAWDLALYIDNTEAVYREAWIICEDFRQGTFSLMESVHDMDEMLLAYGTDIYYCYDDLIEYIENHEE